MSFTNTHTLYYSRAGEIGIGVAIILLLRLRNTIIGSLWLLGNTINIKIVGNSIAIL